MGKMSEKHYEESQQPQTDDPSIEYYMLYPIISKWTKSIYKWFEKKYCMANKQPRYIKSKKVEDIF